MHRFIGLTLAIAACVFASSCAPPVKDYSTPSFPGPRSSPYYFGYLGHADSTLAAFKINSNTGQVTHNGYVVVGDGAATVTTFTPHPGGTWGYAESSEGIFVYAIDPVSGRLSLTAGPYPASVPSGGFTLGTIDPRGTKFYAASNSSGVIYGFTINPSDGTLTPMPGVFVYSGTGATSGPVGITMDQTGNRLYAANAGDSTISSFIINGDASLRSIQQAQSVGAGAVLQVITIHPNGNWAYVPDNSNNVVYAFSIAGNGALALIDATGGSLPGTPLSLTTAGCTAPVQLTIHSAGTLGVMACDTSNNIFTFQVNPANGAIANTGSLSAPAGSNPETMTLSEDEKYVYVATKNGNQLLTGTVDAGAGTVSAAGTLAVRNGGILFTTVEPPAPVDLVTTYGYAADINSDYVTSFSIGSGTGALTQIGVPASAGTQPQYLALDPTGRFIYVPNQGSANVSAYSIDSPTGTLTSLGTAPAAASTALIGSAVDPSGRFLYISDQGTGNLYGFTIDQGTGSLTPFASTFPAGTQPSSIGIDPSGQYLYSGNLISNNVSGYSISPTTGQLTALGGSPFATDSGPRGTTVDPSGEFLYTSNVTAGDVTAFVIALSTGVPTPVGGSVASGSYAAAAGAFSVKSTPNGQFLYAANSASHNVTMFTLNQSSGALTAFGSAIPTDTMPIWMEVDPTGTLAYTTDQSNSNISIFTIDPTSGTLTPAGLQSSGGLSPQSFVARGVLTLQ